MGIRHNKLADTSFTPTGKVAWDENHVVSGLVFSGDYSATSSFNTATAALTETIGINGLATQQNGESTGVSVLTSNWTTSGQPPFQIYEVSAPNSAGGLGTYNHATFFGYNVGRHALGSVTANKPALIMGMEDNYFDPVGDLTYGMEWYVEYYSPDGSSIQMLRPFYTRILSTDNTTNGCITLFNIGTDVQAQFDVRTSASTSLFHLTSSTATISKPLTVTGGAVIQQTDTSPTMTFPASGGIIDMAGVLRGANGANLDTVYRGGNASGLWKWNNAANTVQVMSLSDAGFMKLSVSSTPSLAFLPSAGAGIIYGGGSSSALIFFPNQSGAGTGTGGSIQFRNNDTDSQTHFQVLATAGVAAANHVQVTGAASGANASIKASAENLLLGSGAAISTTATAGYVMFPSCAGTPTGVPTGQAAGKIPMIFDTTGVKLWFYTGGSWKGVVVA